MTARRVLHAALFLVLTAPAVAQYAKSDPAWNKPAKPHRVVGNIYYVGTNELAVFLITTPKGHILLDAGFDESVPLIAESIRALGFRYEDVRVLLNSQAHFDHAAGLARIKRQTGASLAAMDADAALLETGGKDDFRFGDELMFPPVRADRVLKDGDRIELGGVVLTAHHTPGHTKGSTTFATTADEGGKRLVVVFAASTSVNPGTSLVNNPKYPGIVEDWEKTYRVLKSLQPDVWVAAHTGFFDLAGKLQRLGGTPNPYIDPRGYRRYLESGEERFRKLLAEQRAASHAPVD